MSMVLQENVRLEPVEVVCQIDFARNLFSVIRWSIRVKKMVLSTMRLIVRSLKRCVICYRAGIILIEQLILRRVSVNVYLLSFS